MTTDPSYRLFVADLHTLADTLSHLEDWLPLPRYPEQGLSIEVYVASARNVVVAATALDVKAHRSDTGHTTAQLDVGTIHLRFVHVEDAAMAEHRTREAFAATMPDGWPASTLTPEQVTS